MYITLTRLFRVLVDFLVVNAYPRGFAQELTAVRRASRDSYKTLGARASSIKVSSAYGGIWCVRGNWPRVHDKKDKLAIHAYI